MLIAFEGLDQSGKETQARLLGERLVVGRAAGAGGLVSRLRHADRRRAAPRPARRARLRPGRDPVADDRQPLRVEAGDRGGARARRGRDLPTATSRRASRTARRRASIRPGCSTRSGTCRGRRSRDDRHRARDGRRAQARRTAIGSSGTSQLLERVRASYRRQAAAPGWVAIDGERPIGDVAAAVASDRRHGARAAVSARTSRAPIRLSTSAHASQRRPGRRHVVHQDDHRPLDPSGAPRGRPVAARGRERAAHVAVTPRGGQAELRPRRPRAARARGRPAARGCAARSSAWLKPRCQRRRQWSGTGTTQVRPVEHLARRARASAPPAAAPATRRPRTSARGAGAAARRRTRRRHAPTRDRAARRARHRAHRLRDVARECSHARPTPRHRRSAAQRGGESGRIERQQAAHTGPRDRASRARQTARRGSAAPAGRPAGRRSAAVRRQGRHRRQADGRTS